MTLQLKNALMRKLCLLLLTVCFAAIANAQITITVTGNTNTTPNLTPTYGSLAAALTDLNAVTAMTGPVVLTCDAGTSETAPIKGFVLGSATLNPVLSSTNTITINKTGGTVTINAGVGTANGPSATPDGILYLNGADYVTIDGLTFTDGNTLNATVAMEFGVALFKLSAGDGCNNNTIQNCTFNMQRINNNAGAGPMLDGSWAIEVLNSTAAAASTALTPTNGGTLATNGTNSANRFYTNTINNGNGGIGFGGYAATLGVGPAPTATTFLGDLGNDIGGTSSGTGNTITNFGGGAATSPSAGIRANNQWSVNIQYNTVNNNTGAGVNHATTLRGIFAQAGTSANATINNNIVTVQSGATTSLMEGIDNGIGSTAASNTVTINNNTIRFSYTTATTGVTNGILNSATAATVNINGNDISVIGGGSLAGTGTCVMIETGSPTTATANNNSITNIPRSGASGSWRGIKTTSPTNFTANSNTIDGLSWTAAASTGSIDAIYSFSSAVNVTANNNIIRNLSTPATGTITGINEFGSSGLKTFQNNQIYNFTTTAGGAGGGTFRGISESTGTTNTYSGNIIYSLNSTGTTGGTGGTIVGITFSSGTTNNLTNNAIYDLSSTSTNPAVTGINIGGGTTNNINNNLIGDLRATASTGNVTIAGILSASGTTNNIFHNTVNIASTTTSATTFGTSAIYFSSSSPVNNLRNNIFVNTSAPGPTGGFTAAIRYTAAPTSTNFPAANNNNFYYAGVAAANRVLYCEGSSAAPTNGQQTIAAYKTYINTTLPVPGREGSSVSEIPNWVSTTGSNPITTFLQYNTGIATQIEQGGALGTGISTDFAATTRCPGGGCPGAAATPDMGAWELNGLALDLSAPGISYTAIPPTTCVTDRTLSATITDANGVNSTAGTKPRLYFKKSTDANNYVGNTNADNGWKYVEATNASSPFSFTTDYTLLQSAVVTTDIIQYFVVAQDNAPTPNVGINSGTFAAAPASVALTAGAFPIGAPINSYTIVSSVPTSITIGATGTYPTLTGAGGLFADLNAKSLSANTTVTILDAAITEPGGIPLNTINYACGGGPFTLTIKPNTGVTTVLSGSFAGPLIDLNGADLVTFDGSNSGGSSKDMTIRNTSTTGQTFRFINDATDNTIKNTIVEGANTSTTSGTILFSTAATGSIGNSNNIISNCDVRDRSDAAGVPANAIYSSGTASPANANNVVSISNIFNHTNAGVLVSATGAGNGWTISGNSIYQTAARTAALTGISIQGGNGHSVLNNFIGGTAANAGGANLATSSTFTGINLTVGTVSATSVQGNTVKNIRSTVTGFTASYGIFLQAGLANIGNSAGNTIGSANVAERFEINGDSYGIRVISTSSVNLSNNTVNNFGTNATPSTGEFYFGISVEGTGGVHSVLNNTVANVTNASTPDASFSTQTIGMIVQATGIQTVRGNTVRDVGSTSAAAPTSNNNRVWGLIISATPAGTIADKNNVYNIYGSSAGAGARADVISLLQSQNLANATYSNNMVSSGTVNASSDRAIFGILDLSAAPSVSNYYFNSVNITGTGTGANSSYAFNRNSTATVDIRNNIFSNARTGGTGFHVAIANTNAAATGWAATASNYNNLYSANTSALGQWLGALVANNRDFAGWQAAQGAGTPGSGGDANSWNILAPFTSATDLHIPAATSGPLESGGVAIFGFSTDIDNDVRPGPAGSVNGGGTAPDIGVDEFDGTPASPMIYVSSTTTQTNVSNVSNNSTNQEVIGIQIVTSGSLSPISATSFTINTNGTTNVADISNARLWYTGTSGTFATGTQFGAVEVAPNGSFVVNSTQVLQQGTNYFWLTYDVPCLATAGNVIDAECNSLTVGIPRTPTVQAPAGSRTIILGTVSGTKTVGSGGDYATLTAAAAAINSGGLSGNTILSILNNLSEPGAVVINQWAECAPGGYTLTIKPASGVTATVSGSVNSGALIKLNGADRVTIDGSNNGSNSRDLTITNTSTTSPVGVWLSSLGAGVGATDNTIKNCNINTGSNTATSYGVAVAGATLGSTGADNDNTTIQNNNITQVYHGIWANGTASVSAGGLDVLNINNNIIGPVSSGAGNIGFSGINLGNSISPSVASNTVQNIAATAASASGITMANTTAPSVTLNTVQNLASTSTGATGILTASTVTNAVITQNTITGLTATAGGFIGMSIAGASGGSFNVSQNTISAINGTVGSSVSVIGIHVTATSPVTLNRNNVSGVINNSTGTWGAFGINLGGGDGHIVTNNFVSNISQDMSGGGAFSTTFGVIGIRVASGINHQVYHNSVNLYGVLPGTATSSLLTAAFAITGTTLTGCDVRNNIFANNVTGGTTSIAHVSVFLPQSGTSAMNLTWNNNAYFTGTTAGVHGVAHVNTTYAATPAGPATYAGLYTVAAFDPSATTPNANFRSYTSTLSAAGTNDNASLAFTSAVPFTSSTNLHIPAATPGQLESSGAVVGVTADIDNDVRPGPAGSVNGGGTAPDMGADEFDGTPASPMIYISSTTTQNTNSVGNGTTNNHVIGIQVVTSGTLSPLSATSFTLNTNGSTAPLTDITNAKLWYTGNSSTFATGTQFGATDPAPNGAFIITGTQTLSQGTNYFWLTYDIPCTSVLTNVVDAECNTIAIGINRTPTVQAPAGSRTIIAGGLSGSVTIGAAGTYPSITGTGGLFAAINTNGLNGNLTADIIDASVTETGAVALNQATFGCAVGPYNVIIKPGAGVTTTLSGSVATSLIKLNGADNVTIDGSNNGTSSRNMTLTNTGTGSVVWIGTDGTAGATNNTLKNFNMVGPGAFTGQGIIAGSGTTFGSAAENGRPNSDNTVQNLTAKGVQNGIFALGDAATPDLNWVITQNEFGSTVAAEKLSFRGIALQNAQNFSITRNKIIGVSSSTSTSATMTGILVGSTLNGGTIARNEIGDIKQNNTAGWGCNGIFLNSSSTAANVNVLNNVIYDVAAYGYDDITSVDNGYGIMVNSGGGYNIQFNSVRMTTDQTDVAGRPGAINIGAGITTAASLDIRNNIFGNTQTTGNRYAIISEAVSTVFASINYNDYYSAGVVGFNGIAYADVANLAAWQTFSTQDANSVAVDPQYTSATNLALLGSSPVISSGVTIAGVTNDYTNSTRNSPPSIGAYEDKIVVSARLYLSGAYSTALARHKNVTTIWRDVLNANALTQPYGALVNNYGPTAVSAGFFRSDDQNGTVVNGDIVDWVLVDLRDATTPTTIIAQRAAFVREDGLVVDVDGVSPLSFRGLAAGNYFITIRHRNHLGVRTAATQAVDGSAAAPTAYDYSTAQAQAFQNGAILTNAAMKDLTGGKFGLWGGNANANTTVRASGGANPAVNDYAFLINTALGGSAVITIPNVYSNADLNMDGTIRANGGANAAINDYAFLINFTLGGSTTLIITQHQ